jgi:hypothetical protein
MPVSQQYGGRSRGSARACVAVAAGLVPVRMRHACPRMTYMNEYTEPLSEQVELLGI